MINASLTATRAVLMQTDFNGDLHPCAFLSKTLSAAKHNYDIFDCELLAMIHALTEWKHYLQGMGHPVTVLSSPTNYLNGRPNGCYSYRTLILSSWPYQDCKWDLPTSYLTKMR